MSRVGYPRQRRYLTRELLDRAAETYRDAHASGKPPTQAVAEKFNVSHRTATRWVSEARKAGAMGAATGTRAGEASAKPPSTEQADPADRAMSVPELMTAAEHRAMDLTRELVNLLSEIVTDGPIRTSDFRQFKDDIHRIQARILKQAAARAYPDRYRLLGECPSLDGVDA